MISIRDEFKRFRTTKRISQTLYKELYRLGMIVFHSKGVQQQETKEDLFGEFTEKRLLKFSDAFYLKLDSYTDQQVRSYVTFALKNTVLDYLRRQRKPVNPGLGEDSTPKFEFIDLEGEAWQKDLPETLREEYKLMAIVVSDLIWGKLKSELKSIFCLVYSGGKTTQEISNIMQISYGTVDNNKKRIAEAAYKEAEVLEVAKLAYDIIALSCCKDGEVCRV